MAIQVKKWLKDRQSASNMDPWVLLVTDDRTDDPRDWTVDSAGNADQHVGTFTCTDEDGTAVFSGTCTTLTTDGKLIYTATTVQAALLTAGNCRVQWTVRNAGSTLVHESEVYGQRIRANI